MIHKKHVDARRVFWQRWLLFLFCVMFLLVLFLFSLYLHAYEQGAGCGAAALDASCTPGTPTATVPVSLTHTPSPTAVPPTATPPPAPVVVVPPVATPSPVPVPPAQEVELFGQRYMHLVLGGHLRRAYNLLSADLRNREPFDDFQNNDNYTLSAGCWREGEFTVTRIDDQTWDAWVYMTQLSCVDGTTLVTYVWHFQVQLPTDGLPAIISAGLYPTGTGN